MRRVIEEHGVRLIFDGKNAVGITVTPTAPSELATVVGNRKRFGEMPGTKLYRSSETFRRKLPLLSDTLAESSFVLCGRHLRTAQRPIPYHQQGQPHVRSFDTRDGLDDDHRT
jgi:hypothetical protein